MKTFFDVEDAFLISIADVSRAHFYADAVRDVYVRLPDEDPTAKQPGVCGKLRKTSVRIFGCCPTLVRTLCSGFGGGRVFPRRGFSVPLLPQRTCKPSFWCTVTNFSKWADSEGRKHALRLLRRACELSKVVTLGSESSQSRTVSFLGRTLTLRQWGIEYEPDQQHVSRALKALGLTDA